MQLWKAALSAIIFGKQPFGPEQMPRTNPVTQAYILGDLHGYYDNFVQLLSAADLIDNNTDWHAETSRLWLMGDLFDRGPRGIDCLNLAMKLQQQARSCGGDVQSLLGNHEAMLLCAYRFAAHPEGDDVKRRWLSWGGIDEDLARLTPLQINWLTSLPALARLGPYLLMHADSLRYIDYGRSIDAINNRIRGVLTSDRLEEWTRLLGALSERMAFSGLEITGAQRARSILTLFGGQQIIHGHTPISYCSDIPAGSVKDAYCYASQLCINVDAGIYLGSPGFIHTVRIGMTEPR